MFRGRRRVDQDPSGVGAGVVCLLIAASAGWAAEPPTVHVSGVARQWFEPDTVRVRCRVYAHGVTASSAIKKLNAGRAILEKRLAEIETNRPACRLGPNTERAERKAGIAQMQLQIIQGGGDQDEETDKLIRMVFVVTLEWKLKGKTLDDRYRETDAIRQQLEEIGLLEREGAKKANDKESESREEAVTGEDAEAANRARLRVTDGPAFSYVRRLSESETSACARRAFEDARQRATQLSLASGHRLGALVTVSAWRRAAPTLRQTRYASQLMRNAFGGRRPQFDEDAILPDTELVSDRLQPILYQSELSAAFALE